ncbi:hypothetical protein FRC10_005786 [Ceratobasidium sp. 414]|nr:hypothetical protein FRC10_005786 [Ceratobasidium sp. 414]
MPPNRRQRRTQPVSPVYSPAKPMWLASPGPIVLSKSPTAPTEPQVDLNTTSGPNTPTKEDAAVKHPLSVANSPTDRGMPTVVGIPSGGVTPTESGTPNRKGTPEPLQDEENKESGKGPVNSCDNPFKVTSPTKSQAIKASTLREAIENTHRAAALREAIGNPLVWFTSPMGRTGVPILDHALDDLRLSRYCLWMGDSHRVLTNCIWVNGERSSTATLQWKRDAPNKLADSEGDTIIGFVGMVSTDGLTLAPDASWQPSWGEERLHKQKRSFRAVYPGTSSNIQQSWWDTQLDSALRIVEDGCKSTKDGAYEVTHCLVNRQAGYLRVRSPLFQPIHAVQDDDEDATGSTSSEEHVPKDCEFTTWNVSSRGVREAFDRIIQQGYQPQVLQAYTRFNKLIHPNNVTATLSGAIVLVHCTLERMRFSKNHGRSMEFQFYANLVKVQVLKLAPPVKSIAAMKRKFVHSYGPGDGFGPDGRSADRSAPSKRLRLTLPAH